MNRRFPVSTLWLLGSFFLLTPFVLAQETLVIKGRIVDQEKSSLPGVNVFVKGTLDGASSDTSGFFSFSTAYSDTLIIRCLLVGYVPFQHLYLLKEGQQTMSDLDIVMVKKGSDREIVVTASEYSTGVGKGEALSYLDVVTTPGAGADILRALQTLPGVQKIGESSALYVRGGDKSETVMILDGAYIKKPYRFENPDPFVFGSIVPSMIQPSTSFYAGGYSARYGHALSGAMVLSTKNNPTVFQTSFGVGLGHVNAYVDIPIVADKFGISVSGGYANTELMFLLNALIFGTDTTSSRFVGYPQSYDANLNITYQYSSTGKLKLFYLQGGDFLSIDLAYSHPYRDKHYELFNGSTHTSLVNVNLSDKISESFEVFGTLSYTRYHRYSKHGVLDLSQFMHFIQGIFSLSYDPFRWLTLHAGTEFIGDMHFLSGVVPETESLFGSNARFFNVDTLYYQLPQAIWVEIEGMLFYQIGYRAGLRFSYEFMRNTMYLDPRVSLTWTPIDVISVIASIGKYSQFPEPRDNDYYWLGSSANLVPLEAIHYILGVSYQEHDVMLRVEGYYKHYQNLLLLENYQDNRYTNDGYGYSWGVDIFAKYSFGPVNGWTSYSFLTSRRKWYSAPDLLPTIFDVTHTLSTVLKFLLGPFGGGVNYRFSTGRPYTSSSPPLYNDRRVPHYHKLDIQVQYLHMLFNNNVSVFYLVLSNATLHENISGYREKIPIKPYIISSIYFGFQINL